MMYKSKIVKVSEIKPMDSDDLSLGARVREWVDGKPTDNIMRVIQVAGADVLVQYLDNPVKQAT